MGQWHILPPTMRDAQIEALRFIMNVLAWVAVGFALAVATLSGEEGEAAELAFVRASLDEQMTRAIADWDDAAGEDPSSSP